MTTAIHSVLFQTEAEAKSPELAGWEDWLHKAITPDWRRSEWIPDRLLFIGDVNNPATQIRECSVKACDVPTDQARFCTGCSGEHAKSGLTPDVFMAVHDPDRRRRRSGTVRPCLVPSCARHSASLSLCVPHYQGWTKVSGIQEMSDWIKSQRPFAPVAACVVRACDREGATVHPFLCLPHRRQWVDGDISTADPSAHKQWIDRATPYLSMTMFSLAPLEPLARLEVLYCLQRRDARGQNLPPRPVRAGITALTGLPTIAFCGDDFPSPSSISGSGAKSWLTQVRWMLATAVDEFRGIDPTRKIRWDMRAVGEVIPSLRSPIGAPNQNNDGLDFSAIRQDWLRGLLVHWARTTEPRRNSLRRHHRAAAIASEALHIRPGGGTDPATLGYADMSSVVDAFKRTIKLDGEVATSSHQSRLLGYFSDLLDFGRYEGVPDDLSPRFVRHKEHRIKRMEENEDEIGKALPDSIIRQLDKHMHLIGDDFIYGRLFPREAVKALFRTAYVILRDTGRRPHEVAGLSVNCLEFDAGEYQLVWDNRKAGRLRRRLPVYTETVEAIKEWLRIRADLDLPRNSAESLFPALGERHVNLQPGYLGHAIRQWVDVSISELQSDEPGPDGIPLPFDRSRIFPYAFRHTFCQRYADAGVPLHVLQDLMDHKEPKVTGAYYRVSNKMKKEAMDLLRTHATDHGGNPAPIGSVRAYEVQSVAVPYGNCIEPSNVKAGGQACPIRFQCSGCTPFYRPDPSHLPAIEDRVRGMRAQLEIARTLSVEEWTVRGMEAELEGYVGVIEKMKAKLAQLPDGERGEIEQASKVMRRIRAGTVTGRPVALPMPTLRPAEVEQK